MLPTQQGLEATQAAIVEANLRLVNQSEVLLLHGRAYAILEHQPRTRPAIEFLIVEAILLAPRLLGRVHRRIGRTQEAFDIGAAIRIGGDADAHPKAHIQPFHLVADGNAFQQPLGITPGLLRVRQAVEQCGELVPAHTRQQRFTAQAILELFGYPVQHPVARVVAERVVDALEAIQVHVHQRLRLVRTLVAQQRTFGGLVEPAAVEQAGKRVGDGLVLQLLVQVAHHRHVQHGDHHGLLVGRQWRTGQRHRHQLAAKGAQLGIVHAEDAPPQVGLVEVRFVPQAGTGQLHQVEQVGALQLLHRR
ncbi:hypothetical protein D3C78_824060 [compost metagenome]